MGKTISDLMGAFDPLAESAQTLAFAPRVTSPPWAVHT